MSLKEIELQQYLGSHDNYQGAKVYKFKSLQYLTKDPYPSICFSRIGESVPSNVITTPEYMTLEPNEKEWEIINVYEGSDYSMFMEEWNKIQDKHNVELKKLEKKYEFRFRVPRG